MPRVTKVRTEFRKFSDALVQAATNSWVSSGKPIVVTQDRATKKYQVWYSQSVKTDRFQIVVATVTAPDLSLADAEQHFNLIAE